MSDLDEAIIESSRETATAAKGAPYLGQNDWAKMILDLCAIIDKLKKEKADLIAAVQRNAETP
jgi:hypothetical protein